MSATDQELLRQYLNDRSEVAFTELVNRHVGLVYSAALRQANGDWHTAQDVTQAVFIDLARKAAWLVRHPTLAGWLYTSTRYLAANARRSAVRRSVHEHAADAMKQASHDSSLEFDWNALAPILDEAMHALGSRDRAAVLLRYFEREEFRTIGTHLGISEEAARKRVERALGKLRVILARRGIASSSLALGTVLAERAVAGAPSGLAQQIARAAAPTVRAGVVAAWLAALWPLASFKPGAGIAAGLLLLGGAAVWLWPFAPERLARGQPEVTAEAPAVAEQALVSSTAASWEAAPLPTVSGPDANVSQLQLVLVTADTGQPIPNGDVHCFHRVAQESAVQKLRANRQGHLTVRFPIKTVRLELFTKIEGFADVLISWHPERGENIPSQYIARLRRAASIGGNVVDPSGRPVHGAKITVHLTDSVLNTTPPEVPVAGVEAESDETGAWQTSRVAPELVRRLNIYANHPDYARSPNLYPGTDPQLERQLLDKTLVLRLGMAAAVFGQVVDSDGAPIEGAAILVGRRWYPDARKAKTAVDGSFSVAGCASGHTLITAEAEGFAPKTMAVKVSEDSAPVRIALTAGKELSVKVVDRNGDPVSKAYVSLSAPLAVEANADSGTLVPQFSFDARADAEGRCMFPNVPEVELELYVGADGFMEQRGHRLDLSIPRLTVTLRPAVTVLGSVRDSATGKPLPKFRIVTGCPDQDGVHWSTIDRFHLNFQGGAFCHTYTESVVGVGQNSGYFLRFEAHGYQPCVSRLIAPSEEMVQLDVALQPAALRQFVVLSPEGKPVSGADVVVVSRLERPIGLVPGGFDRRYERSDGALRCTDESGQVALAADDEIKPVIIACPAGYAEIDTGNLPDESTLQLQPWGRIEGVLSSEAQAAGCEIQFDFDRTRRAEIFVDVSTAFRAKPDVTGQFAFPLVPPGRHRLWEALPGPAFSLVNGIDLEVHAGQTTAVNTQSKQVPLNGLLKAGE